MVEAGVLSAVAVVFAVINLYIPLLGIFLNVFWPVPLVLLGVRHGLKWSALALASSALILAIIVNPLQSLLQAAGLGGIGLVLGWSLNKGNPPVMTLGFGAAASLLSKILVIALLFLFAGGNPFDLGPETIAKAVSDTMELYRSFGMSDAELAQIKPIVESTLNMMKLILPAGIVFAAFFDAYANLWLARAILGRLGTFTPGLPEFKNLLLHQHFLLFYGVSLLLTALLKNQPDSLFYQASVNANFIMAMPILLQGIAVAWSFSYRKNWPGISRWLLVSMLILLQPVSIVVIFLGMADFVFDFRKLRPPRT
jgi:uncharacterized protein YybS (DUF2232 family)